MYIGVGSNLDRPVEQISRAIAAMEILPELAVISISRYVRNPALGETKQPDYINAAVGILTTLDPEPLLDVLQTIEHDQGRVRSELRWQPRTIDLDILVYAQKVVDTQRLSVPHAQLQRRNFVLGPLYDIAPDLMVPEISVLK